MIDEPTRADISAIIPAAPAGEPVPDPLWYKDAVVYELHIKAYADANGDGIGDFRGLTERLDHVQSLGVNTIWLLPRLSCSSSNLAQHQAGAHRVLHRTEPRAGS